MMTKRRSCAVCTQILPEAEEEKFAREDDNKCEKLFQSQSEQKNGYDHQLSLLSTLWNCLRDTETISSGSNNSFSVHGDEIDRENAVHFCQNCEKYLVEFEQITKDVRRLHRRLTTVKYTIIAKFLNASETFQDDHLNKSKVQSIREQLKNELMPNVILEKTSSSLLQEAIRPERGNNHEEIIGNEADVVFCPSEESSCDFPTGDVNSFRAESRAPKKANNVFRNKKVKCVQIGPTEYLYGDKYKFTCQQDNCFQCTECSATLEGRASMIRHIRRIHMYSSAVQKKRIPEKCRGLFKWKETGPNEFIYAEKFKFSFNGEKYYCEECGSLSTLMDSMFRHMRWTHIVDKNGSTPLTPRKNRLIPVENRPNEYMYRGKYEVSFFPEKGTYQCKLCELEQVSPGRVMDHIEKIHFLGGKKAKYRLKSVSTIAVAPNEFLYNGKYPFKFDPAEQVYACGVCDYQNDNIRCIYPHIRANHYTNEDKKQFSAVQVSKNEFLYGEKYRIFFQGGKYFCGLCNYNRFDLSDLYGHIRRHHLHEEPDKVVPETAHVQDEPVLDPTSSYSLTYQGISYSFDASSRRFTCSICPVNVRHRSTMLMHLRQRHVDKPGQHVCETCGDSFQGQRLLNRHKSNHGGPKFKCTHCGKVFRRKETFRVHMAIHEFGDEAKQFQCEYCGKKFVRKRFLDNHVRIHTGEKPYKCDLCSEMFADSAKKSYHRKIVHGILPKKLTLD